MGLMNLRRMMMESGPHEIPQYETAGPADVVTFESNWAMPMRSLKVGIDPVQDLHGYENPWPAGGGKNLFDNQNALFAVGYGGKYYKNGFRDIFCEPTETGFKSEETNTDCGRAVCLGLLASGTYTLSFGKNLEAINVSITKTDSISLLTWDPLDRVTVASSFVSGSTFTADGTSYYWLSVYYSNAERYEISNIQLEKGSTASSWTPYSNICPISGWTGAQVVVSPTQDAQDGNTYSISWETEAGTVYGGTLDVVSGELVVDRAYIIFDGSEDELWYTYSSTGYRVPRNNIGLSGNGICNIAPTVSSALSYGVMFSASNNYIYFFQTVSRWGVATIADLRAWLATNNVEVCYELAKPITYHLTPQEVRTLLGQNNVWADTGDSTVEYYADTKRYINKRIAEIVN